MTRRKRNDTTSDQAVTVIRLRPGQQVTLAAPKPAGPELLGPHELADLLGVTRQRVHQLTAAPTFPEPAARLAIGKVWLADHIRAWAAERGRTLTR